MVSGHETPNAVFSAGHARNQHAIHHRWRRGDRIPFLPFGDLGFPDFLSGFRIERLQVGVDRGDEYLAVVERHSPVREPAAHDARSRRVPLDGCRPDLPAGRHVDCHRLSHIGYVHHPVVDERLPLLADLVRKRDAPDRDEALDRALVDLLEGTVALLVIAHAVGQHVVGAAAVAVAQQLLLRLSMGERAERGKQDRSCQEFPHKSPFDRKSRRKFCLSSARAAANRSRSRRGWASSPAAASARS